MRILYGLNQSPWTEKARWSLDHHRVEYTYRKYVPMLGEPLLRMEHRKVRSDTDRQAKPSVPLLVDGDVAFPNSLAIARHAETIGQGARLFPEGEVRAIERWNDVSDRMIGVGRARVLARLQTDAAFQRESVPDFVPEFARGLAASSTALVGRFMISKHGVPTDVAREVTETLRPALLDVQSTLQDRSFLVGIPSRMRTSPLPPPCAA